jgi:hypothetical protein
MENNPWKEKGIPTTINLETSPSVRIPYIMGVVALTEGFDSVRSIKRTDNGILLKSASGQCIEHSVDTHFLQ